MKGSVRALYKILVCTALLVVGVRASDDLQNIFMDHAYEEPMSPLIRNEDMNLLLELLDESLGNLASFIPDAQLVSTYTEDIEYSSYLSSSSTTLHNLNIDQPRTYTELIPCTGQTDPLSSFYGTVCESGTECLLSYYNPNEPVQKHTESESISNYKQSSKAKRPKKAIEENTPRKKQKKTEESSLDSDSTDNDELNSSRITRIKKNISIWNNSKLKNRHRENLHQSYKPVIILNKFRSNKYKEIGDKIHQSLIETHVKHYKTVYSKIPVQNEFWFTIASRTSYIHTKIADCKAINANPPDYNFIESLSGYYPSLPGDIVGYIDKHGPIISDQKSIRKEWTETLGDIHVRTPIELEYEIGKEIITIETSNKYRPVAITVQMILSLPEVHKDLSNLTSKFIEKTLKKKEIQII